MKYYKLENRGFAQRWVECQFNPEKRQITLYNDDFIIMGIGLY